MKIGCCYVAWINFRPIELMQHFWSQPESADISTATGINQNSWSSPYNPETDPQISTKIGCGTAVAWINFRAIELMQPKPESSQH